MKIKRVQEVEGVEVPKPFERMVRVVFAPDQDGVEDLNLISAVIYPKSSTDYRLRDRTELIYIISGRGMFVCNGNEFALEPDTAILVERGDKIQLKNPGPETLKLVSVYVQPFRASDLYQTLVKSAQEMNK
ncbi:MAG: AraC family ligand binding domain-containing protein [Atribacterales bacterium]